ncbi:MAG: exosortase-associated EpsI family protein [Akkermansia sp.]
MLCRVSIVKSGHDLNNSIHRPERRPAQGHFNLTGTKVEVFRRPRNYQDDGAEIPANITPTSRTIILDSMHYYVSIGHRHMTEDHLARTLTDMKDRVRMRESALMLSQISTAYGTDQGAGGGSRKQTSASSASFSQLVKWDELDRCAPRPHGARTAFQPCGGRLGPHVSSAGASYSMGALGGNKGGLPVRQPESLLASAPAQCPASPIRHHVHEAAPVPRRRSPTIHAGRAAFFAGATASMVREAERSGLNRLAPGYFHAQEPVAAHQTTAKFRGFPRALPAPPQFFHLSRNTPHAPSQW